MLSGRRIVCGTSCIALCLLAFAAAGRCAEETPLQSFDAEAPEAKPKEPQVWSAGMGEMFQLSPEWNLRPVDWWDGRRIHRGGAGPPMRPITLVVLGTARATDNAPRSEATFDVQVDKVLYGGLDEKTLTITSKENIAGDKPQILALAHVTASYTGPAEYEVIYRMPREQEKWQKALSVARLDLYVLSAAYFGDQVFIGKETAVDVAGVRTIEVTRTLVGTSLKAGEKIEVDFANDSPLRRKKAIAKLRSEPMVYFADNRSDYAPRATEEPAPLRPAFRVYRWLPARYEADVLDALKNRDAHPVNTLSEDHRVREVIFRGSVEDAIGMLGSETGAVVSLGAITLAFRGETVRPKIAAAIERDLLHQAEAAPLQFRRLRTLIFLLGDLREIMGRENLPRADSDRLRSLLEKLIAHIASNPPEPPAVARRSQVERCLYEETDREDVNHALSWLIEVLDEGVVLRDYAERLVQLRDAAKGRWRQEVQLALDSARIEDTFALTAALARTNDIAPVRSAINTGNRISQLCFSADGKTLRSVGRDNRVCTWDARTLEVVRRTSPPEGYRFGSVRERDGRYAMCYPDDDKRRSIKCLDLETGRVACNVGLSPALAEGTQRLFWLDGDEALCTGGGQWLRFNYRACCIVGQGKIDDFVQSALVRADAAITENGKSILVIDGYASDGFFEIEKHDLRTRQTTRLEKIEPPFWPEGKLGLVPGGRYLHIGVQIYDRRTLKPVAVNEFRGVDLRGLAFSPDGSRYAAVTEDHGDTYGRPRSRPEQMQSLVRIHETLTGRMLTVIPRAVSSDVKPAFAPDARRVAIVTDNERIEVWPVPATP